ncbi:MAG TPA: response regulator [Bdellovibrionales bacterium]|mgnify:CR=1 FL=1|nr:response regulator [Bdellovibrionales bacterium]
MSADRVERVLIADASADMRDYFSRMLSPRWEIYVASNGREALRISADKMPDLVIADLDMPKIDGISLLQKIRSIPKLRDLPIILVSPKTEQDAMVGALAAGANDFITKPVQVKELIARIDSQLKLKLARAALEHERNKMYSLFKNAPVGVMILRGPSHVIEHCNLKAKEYVGGKNIEGLSTVAAFAVLGIPTVIWPLDEIYRTGVSRQFHELHFRLGSGDSRVDRYFDIGCYPWFDNDGSVAGIFCVSTDVTDQVLAKRELQHSIEDADSANQAKSQFLANMSHEIRTPLGIIQGFADLALQETCEVARTSYLKTIRRNACTLERLIGEVLDLSKVEAGKIEIEKIRFSLRGLIEDVCTSMTLKAQEKGIVFRNEIHKDVPEYVVTDPTRLRQVFVNLVSNAIKFTDKGEVRVTTGMPARSSSAPAKIEFEVSDTGIGMTPEQTLKLFKPFSQGDTSMNRRYGGTGLGLSLSKRLSQVLGGDLTLKKSDLGRGSVFRFCFGVELPGAGAVPDDKRPEDKKPRPRKERLRGIRVLVVEDSSDNQFLIGQCLKTSGATVDTANDGVEGVQQVSRERYDLILMDIQMPKMDGYQAMEEIRRKDRQVPIVALTAHALTGEKDRALRLGFSDYLTKPLRPSALVDIVERHVHH